MPVGQFGALHVTDPLEATPVRLAAEAGAATASMRSAADTIAMVALDLRIDITPSILLT
jgi:hypothetical protein